MVILENKITKIENTVDGLNSRNKGTEERINELEDRAVEVIQSEQQGKNKFKKMIRVSGTSETKTKDNIVSLESQKEKRNTVRLKKDLKK